MDAIAWVLGEQGAKALRGGKMEDVIFAGTAGRAPLGRAEVTLTIDNTDGALPIEYTEVSITRRMFRSGESEYEISGNSCRLLDIQELLSDSGIGREMHIIVGQGRLDGMLHAKPEDRRAFIEEAAGVLKHRKRKEKALRKLDAMQVNLNRLTDLTAELRRQLKPLGRQAEVARRAAAIQANLRDARLRLLADDLATLRTTLDREIADETAVRERREQIEGEHAEVQGRLGELEAALAEDAPLLAAAQDTWYKLSALQERFRSIEQLARERLRHLSASGDDERPGVTRTSWRPRRNASASRRRNCARRSPTTRSAWPRPSSTARSWSGSSPPPSGSWSPRPRPSPTGGRAWPGSPARSTPRGPGPRAPVRRSNASPSRTPTPWAAPSRRRPTWTLSPPSPPRPTGTTRTWTPGTPRRSPCRSGRRPASGHWPTRSGRRRRTPPPGRPARRRSPWGCDARTAPELCSPAPGRARPAREPRRAAHRRAGPRGRAGRRTRGLADAVAISGVDEAVEAMRLLKISDAGRAGLLVGSPAGPGMTGSADALRPKLPGRGPVGPDLVECGPELRPAVHRALRDVALVDDLAAAAELVASNPELRAVTPDGDVVGAYAAAGGSAKAPATSRCRRPWRRPAPTGSPPNAPARSCGTSSSRHAPR
ncbi:hypothetical protein NKG94_25830 [Micromonospora sp. M12]